MSDNHRKNSIIFFIFPSWEFVSIKELSLIEKSLSNGCSKNHPKGSTPLIGNKPINLVFREAPLVDLTETNVPTKLIYKMKIWYKKFLLSSNLLNQFIWKWKKYKSRPMKVTDVFFPGMNRGRRHRWKSSYNDARRDPTTTQKVWEKGERG